MTRLRLYNLAPPLIAALMAARVVCSIDLDALTHNLRVVRGLVGETVQICAVVKANAYGHGAIPVARTLTRAGANSLAVTNLEEARELSDAGISVPILLLSGLDPVDAPEAIRRGLVPILWDEDDLQKIGAALPPGSRLPIHWKVDTGLRRLGAYGVAPLARAARDLPLAVEGILSHLACADEPAHPSIGAQTDAFHRVVAELEASGIQPRLRHLANSAGILAGPQTHFDMVRPGLMLYGCCPGGASGATPALKPVMELRTRVLHLKSAPANAGVGYGWTFSTRRESRLAVLAIGYGQGYPRALSNRGEVSIRGHRAPVVGAVSMDYITIDVTDIEGIRPGDEVTLWGGPRGPDVGELASRAGTIAYELLTRIGRDIPRLYKGKQA